MRHRTHARRKQPAAIPPHATDSGKGQFESRPFPVENTEPPPPTQAQQERVARPTPSVMEIPLYPSAAGANNAAVGSTLQAKRENNLKPPQGTVQRQQADEKNRKEQLNMMPESANALSEEDDRVQRQATEIKDEEETAQALQAKEDEQEQELQAKEEAEEDADEADEEIQTKEEEKAELHAKLERKRSQSEA